MTTPPAIATEKPWRWGSLVLITIFVIPLILLGIFIISSGAQALIGPVNVFNASRGTAPADEVAGFYGVRSKDPEDLPRRGIFITERSGIRLNEDHTMELMDLPAFAKDGSVLDCHYNAKGTWALIQRGKSVQLRFSVVTPVPPPPGELPSCGLVGPADWRMLGHSQPYRFWYPSSPDQSGLKYERR